MFENTLICGRDWSEEFKYMQNITNCEAGTLKELANLSVCCGHCTYFQFFYFNFTWWDIAQL